MLFRSEINAGQVYVYHGSSTGLDYDTDGCCPSGADWCVEVDQAQTGLGRVVAAAGDVNDDGKPDLLGCVEWSDGWLWGIGGRVRRSRPPLQPHGAANRAEPNFVEY